MSEYSSDFIMLRRAIFMNFIAANAPIREEDLTPEICHQLIEDIGKDYIRKNKASLTRLPKNADSNQSNRGNIASLKQ